MPLHNYGKGQFDDRLQWEFIDDFSQGIVDQNRGAINKFTPAPLGSADPNTFGCISLPSGGLGPLPTIDAQYTVTSPDTTATIHVTGCAAIGPIGAAATYAAQSQDPKVRDYLHFSLEWVSGQILAGQPIGTRWYIWGRYGTYNIPVTNSQIDTQFSSQPTPVSDPTFFYGTSWALSRMATHGAAAPFSADKMCPIVATEWGYWTDYTTFGGLLQVSPDPNTAVNKRQLIPAGLMGTTPTGPVVSHQGRIVQLMRFYLNQEGSDSQGNTFMVTPDLVIFTDPPGADTLIAATAAELFMPEAPFGYGAWGTQSAGELMLIKRHGGACIVSGDIANPTITSLPGVQSTGQAGMAAIRSSSGMLYVVQDGGVWAWDGSNSAKKISTQVDDLSFSRTDCTLISTTNHCCLWNEWAMFTNNWLFDTQTGSWWKLDNTVHGALFTESPTNSDIIYSFNPTIPLGVANPPTIFRYNRTLLTDTYTWVSNIMPQTVNRVVDVREVALQIAFPSTDGWSITVNCLDDNGNMVSTKTITTTGDPRHQLMRFKLGNAQVEGGLKVSVAVTKTPTNNNPGPIIHLIAVGYEVSNKRPSGV